MNYYLNKSGRFPLYENTDVTYYPIGEKMFQSMLVELDKAKDFIFMEYFIVDDGYMWDNILEVLIKKANEGVDVRVMYDGTCEFALLPRTYPSSLEKLGIHCKVFSPVFQHIIITETIERLWLLTVRLPITVESIWLMSTLTIPTSMVILRMLVLC